MGESKYQDGRHYDLIYQGLSGDLPFYLKQAQEANGPILELACGTGRLTLPLAAQGVDITGLDISPAQLDWAKNKAAGQGLKVNWVQADCRNFHFSRRFSLIFLPFNSLCYLHDRPSLEACLSRVKEHLADDGRFIVDFFNPRLKLLTRDPASRYPVTEYPDPDGSGQVVITEENHYDAATQINHITWYHRFGETSEFTSQLDMRIYFPQELDALLHYNGFAIQKKYGDFDQSPFTSASPKQVIVTAPSH